MISFENFFAGVGAVIVLVVVCIVIFGVVAISANALAKFIYGVTPLGTPAKDPAWWMYIAGPVLFVVITFSVISFFSWIGNMLP